MPTLIEVAIRNVAAAKEQRPMRATMHAAQAVADLWAMAQDVRELGYFPTQVEHAERWGLTERQVQRIWERHRLAFYPPGTPPRTSPERMAKWLAQRIDERSIESEGQAFSYPVPSIAA